MTTSATEAGAPVALDLAPAEQAVLAAEVPPFAASLGDPTLRARYAELEAAVAAGHVPPPLVGLVEALADLLLPTGRVRRQGGPEAERALVALYERTPRGAGLRRSAEEVTQALSALRGQRLDGLTFAPTPGGQRLRIVTEAGQVELLIDRAGVHLERVDLGSAL